MIEQEQLEQMRSRGGSWACYENVALDSASCGHRIYIKFGKDCTHETPPSHAPDGSYGTGWKYLFKGIVNLDSGEVT